MTQKELEIIQAASKILDHYTEPGNGHQDKAFQAAIGEADDAVSFLIRKTENNPNLITKD